MQFTCTKINNITHRYDRNSSGALTQ